MLGIKEMQDIEVIRFSRHFRHRLQERPITAGLVRKLVSQPDSLVKATKIGRRYKLWLRMSRKYALVLVVVLEKKCLYIITGYNQKWKR